MLFKRLFKDKYAGSSPENASVVRTLFDLFFLIVALVYKVPLIQKMQRHLFHFVAPST